MSSFKLNLDTSAHASLIQNTFHNWINSPRDVFFVSSEGHKLFLQSSVLRFYSSWLSDILDQTSQDVESIGITVEAPSVTLTKMFKVLTSGVVLSHCKEELLRIIEVAASIGINLTNYQIGQRLNPSSNVKVKKYKKSKMKAKEANSEIVNEEKSENENVSGKNSLNQNVNGNNNGKESKTCISSNEPSSQIKMVKNEFECNHCFKIIKGTMSHFKRHVDTHLGLRFRCILCPKSFSRKDNLKLHYKFNHPGEFIFEENMTSSKVISSSPDLTMPVISDSTQNIKTEVIENDNIMNYV